MARDRQRAKQRRRRQDGGGAAARSAARTKKARDVGLDDATVDDAGLGDRTPASEPLTPRPRPSRSTARPRPIRSTTPRPTSTRPSSPRPGAVPPEVGDADNEYDGGYDDFDDARPRARRGRGRRCRRLRRPGRARAPARKQRGRVLTFLRHCADELRRVQWPNRRQVGQATAVVLGFVVLAGGYLGLLDALWKPIIDAIL